MKNLYIPEPCLENWESMPPQEKGKFCSVCNKCVIDFTQKEPQEIQQIIDEKKEEPICGRFYNHQLINSSDSFEKLKTNFFKYIPVKLQNNKIALSVFSVLLFLVGCSKPKEEVCDTTEGVLIEKDSGITNNKYVVGRVVMTKDHTIAKIPKKDSLKTSKKHHRK